ncbi:MAG TPA: xanthine dehydrogenase family protein subunit M [Rhizomicrobium sp.]|jgi:carbon-monoxide dehydrogenase medium subunit|nr:xanthine dehydrogenase family protein subunit M [Rhizomicrobium sp.]
MIPYAFTYHRPRTLSEAEALFSQAQDPRFLAGGQTLITAMKQRLAGPSDLIDLSGLPELSFIAVRDNEVIVGAGTLHCEIAESAEVRRGLPALAALAETIGDPAVRHRGTLGGSLANSDPAADYPAAVLGLAATITTTRRDIEADEFFLGMFETGLEKGEIIKQAAFSIPLRAGYAKLPNPASRYAIVGVFVAQTETAVRVAVTGAAPCPFRIAAMEEALLRRFHPDSIAAISVPSEGLNSDLHASAEYRAHLVGVMAKRAVAAALRSGPADEDAT